MTTTAIPTETSTETTTAIPTETSTEPTTDAQLLVDASAESSDPPFEAEGEAVHAAQLAVGRGDETRDVVPLPSHRAFADRAGSDVTNRWVNRSAAKF